MPKVLETKLKRKAKKRGLSKKLAQLMGSVTEDERRGTGNVELVFHQFEFFDNKFAKKNFGLFLIGATLSTRAEIIAL